MINDFIPTVKQPVKLSIRDCQNLAQGLLEALHHIFTLSSFKIFILANIDERNKFAGGPTFIISDIFQIFTALDMDIVGFENYQIIENLDIDHVVDLLLIEV